MPLSLYLDDCADDDILAALLRRTGHQVHTPRSAGTSGASDDEHLAYAAHRGYTLLTKDPDDFLDLHRHWRATNRTHSGILIVYEEKEVSKNMTRAQLAMAIDHLVASGVLLANEIHILNHCLKRLGKGKKRPDFAQMSRLSSASFNWTIHSMNSNSPMIWSVETSWGHGLGPTVFRGHGVARGREPDEWIAVPTALIQIGDRCGAAQRAVTSHGKTGVRNRHAAVHGTKEVKHEKCYRTGVLIDKSLLMGNPYFGSPPGGRQWNTRLFSTRRSGEMKYHLPVPFFVLFSRLL